MSDSSGPSSHSGRVAAGSANAGLPAGCIARQAPAGDLIRNLEAVGEVVANLPIVSVSPDPDDNVILATAIAGQADLVVSGDKRHMLILKQVDDIPIVTAAVAAARVARLR